MNTKYYLNLLIQDLVNGTISLIDDIKNVIKPPKPSRLAHSIVRFTNSTWVEDLFYYKNLDQYTFKGKAAPYPTYATKPVAQENQPEPINKLDLPLPPPSTPPSTALSK